MTKFWASDENFHRRKFSPTKTFTDEVFASKVYDIIIDTRETVKQKITKQQLEKYK